VTPKVVSLVFLGAWTLIVGAASVWGLYFWRRSWRQRAVRTPIGEIDEANFPKTFRVLMAGGVLSLPIGILLVLIGVYLFISVLVG
jgi:hypothetical protein